MLGQHTKAEREEAAAEALVSYLASAGHVCTWTRVKCDPPDFSFIVDGLRWAVEETTLRQTVISAGQPIERQTVERALERKLSMLCDEIMREIPQPPGQGYLIMPLATVLDLSKKRDYEAFKAG